MTRSITTIFAATHRDISPTSPAQRTGKGLLLTHDDLVIKEQLVSKVGAQEGVGSS